MWDDGRKAQVMAARRDRSYEKISVTRGGKLVTVARFAGGKCGSVGDITLGSKNENPQRLASFMRQRGWQADAHRRDRTKCPTCLGVAPQLELVVRPEGIPSDQGEDEQMRKPTPDQRQKIRELLELHFDEELGVFAEGWSDERVALEAGDLPRAVVSEMRDAAWGPVLMNEKTLKGLTDLAEAKQEYGKLRTDLDQLRELFGIADEGIRFFRDRLDRIEQQLRARG
jgi:hypothetical protein